MRIKKTMLFMAISLLTLASCKVSLMAMLKEKSEDLNIDTSIVSKNQRSRGDKKVKALVLHCVGLSAEWVLKNYALTSEEGGLGVSAHYFIPQSKKIYQFVSEEKSAYHAGVSEWRSLAKDNDLKGLNDISIGIEFQSLGYGHIDGKTYFPFSFQSFQPEQIQTGILLSQAIMKRHDIKPENVVWHSDITPRKTDPGPLCDGKEFAKKGVGVWPSADRLEDSQLRRSLEDLQRQLMSWGYPGITQIGNFDESTKYALQAHYMHYLPRKVDWKSFQTQSSGTIFDSIKEWAEFPYSKDELAISLENLNKKHFEKF